MSKPWDHLRVPVVHLFRSGQWKTTHSLYPVTVSLTMLSGELANVKLEYTTWDSGTATFTPKELREVGEFFLEVSDQMQGK